MKSCITFLTDKGVPMNLRIVWKHDGYGSDLKIEHDQDDPLIEFYAANLLPPYFDKSQEFGYFISRYNWSILKDAKGLCLEGSMREYDVDSEVMSLLISLIKLIVERKLK